MSDLGLWVGGTDGNFRHRRKVIVVLYPCSEVAGCLKNTHIIPKLFHNDHCKSYPSIRDVSMNTCGTCRYSLHPHCPSTYNISASASAPYSPVEVSLFVARKASADPVLDSSPCQLPVS